MFNPEGMWGTAKGFARNRAYPAVSMLKSCADIEAASRAHHTHKLDISTTLSTLLVPRVPPIQVPELAILDGAIASTPDGCLLVGKPQGRPRNLLDKEARALHILYLQRPFGSQEQDDKLTIMRICWDSYVAHLQALPVVQMNNIGVQIQRGAARFKTDKSYADHLFRFAEHMRLNPSAQLPLLATRMPIDYKVYRSIQIGEVKFKAGDWFMARPSYLIASEAGAWWFGQIETVIAHKGPVGMHNAILKVRGRLLGKDPVIALLVFHHVCVKLAYSVLSHERVCIC